MDLRGFLVRCHRLQRNYSQEGLCRGICAVSYLSKLEQGKVQAADEIYQALFHRKMKNGLLFGRKSFRSWRQLGFMENNAKRMSWKSRWRTF